VDVLVTHVALMAEHDRHSAGAGTEEPAMQARLLRYIATSISGLTVTGRAAPVPPTGSVVTGCAATLARERVAAPPVPLHRVVWPKVDVGDAGCRYALHQFATYYHSGEYRAFYGSAAQDKYMSRESKLDLCLKLALPLKGSEGLATLHSMWAAYLKHERVRRKRMSAYSWQSAVATYRLKTCCRIENSNVVAQKGAEN